MIIITNRSSSLTENYIAGPLTVLLKHRTDQHGRPGFQCFMCEYIGKKLSTLQTHFMSKHCDGKQLYCDKCPFVARSKENALLKQRTFFNNSLCPQFSPFICISVTVSVLASTSKIQLCTENSFFYHTKVFNQLFFLK